MLAPVASRRQELGSPGFVNRDLKLDSVSAEHWLADVLAKLINGWPAARLDELLP